MSPSRDAVVGLVSSLVAIPSLSGEEAAVQRFIARWLDARGVPASLEAAGDGLVNVVAEIRGSGEGPVLLLGGHCDTVAAAPGWSTDAFTPTVREGRLYGLGALDMKGGLAAAMVAITELAARRGDWAGTIVFASLADEEAHSRGARAFLGTGRRIDAAVMGEPHFDDPTTGAIGKVNLRISALGRSAHGSRPHEGVNAVTAAARLVAALDGHGHRPHARFGPASHCVLGISSGNGRYEIRVPDRCDVLVNWHLMPGETAADAKRIVEALAAPLASQARFDVTADRPVYESYIMDEPHPLLDGFAESYRRIVGEAPRFTFGSGVSDANLFNAAGIPTLLFGPGGRNLHAADEWVELDELAAASVLYRDIGLTFARTMTKGLDRAA